MSMDISRLPSNSDASKRKAAPATTTNAGTEKRATKVVTGTVKTKKNEIRKFTDIFVAEDMNSVKDYLIHDLAIPTLKNLFVDLVQNAVEMSILGSKRGGSGRSRNSYMDNYTYRDYGGYSRNESRYEAPPRSSNRFDYDDIVFTNRGDAEAVLDQMQFLLDKYKLVRVADLYDMCGRTAPYTSHDYGWTSLARARVVSVRGGYIIEMPRASVID